MANSMVPTLLHRLVLALLFLLLPLLNSGQAEGRATPAAASRRGTSLRSQAGALLHWKSSIKYSSKHQLGTWGDDGMYLCNWTGITCGDTLSRRGTMVKVITGISLDGAGIAGRLDKLRFQSLPYLFNLDLSDNYHLSGAIPPGIGSLSMLSTLNFSGDQLSGHIPASFCNLGQLTGMDLSSNNLTGQNIALERDHTAGFSFFTRGPVSTGRNFGQTTSTTRSWGGSETVYLCGI